MRRGKLDQGTNSESESLHVLHQLARAATLRIPPDLPVRHVLAHFGDIDPFGVPSRNLATREVVDHDVHVWQDAAYGGTDAEPHRILSRRVPRPGQRGAHSSG